MYVFLRAYCYSCWITFAVVTAIVVVVVVQIDVGILFEAHRLVITVGVLLGVPLGTYQAVGGVDVVHEAPDLIEVLLAVRHSAGTGRVAEIVALRLVLLHMPIEIRLLAEGLAAESTLKWTLLVVDVPDVALQVRGDAERPVAEFARIRLLPGVGPQVSRQIGRPGKHLAAELARIPVLCLECLVSRSEFHGRKRPL